MPSVHDIAVVTPRKQPLHAARFSRPSLEAFENPLRVDAAIHYLDSRGVFDWVDRVDAPQAKIEDVRIVHSEYLIESVGIMTELGSGDIGEASYASPELMRAALYAVGSATKAAELTVMRKKRHAFSLSRPPGHHATTSAAMGLCFFNNIAIAVKRIMTNGSVQRVSILDFDSHHGNGTSEIFYAARNVQYISVHEYDYETYGQGHFSEIGYGEAAGTKVNIPLLESSPDVSYESALTRVVVPAIQRFKPDIIAVSAGYDPHFADPVGNMDVDSSTFWRIGSAVKSLVDSTGCGGSFWVLEGGYNPLALGPCIEASLLGLAGQPKPDLPDQIPRRLQPGIAEANDEILDQVLETVEPYW